MRRIIALIAVAILLAACAGDAGGGGEVTMPAGEAPRGNAAGSEGRGDGAFGDVDFQLVAGRRVIHTARLHLHAADTRAAYDRITELVTAAGGFVASADVRPVTSPDAQPQVIMTLRAPSARLSATLAEVKAVADQVVSESLDSRDVSDQFVDLEARLTNLRALETELRALLEEVRRQPDADPEKLLRVFNELASVRGQIEQIQGQLVYLSNLTDLATVEVTMTQTPTAAPIVEEPWAPAEAFRDAARSLVAALQGMADWVIRFAVFVLPVMVLALAVPAGIAFYAYRRWWRERSRPSPDPAEL